MSLWLSSLASVSLSPLRPVSQEVSSIWERLSISTQASTHPAASPGRAAGNPGDQGLPLGHL